jgi:hypothetical protein
MPRWKMSEPYEGPICQGCLNCPPVERIAPLSMIVAVGFGSAMVTCGNKVVFIERPDDEEFHTLQEFEDMALQNPNHRWQVSLQAPLRGRTYERQAPGKWVLIESNEGFA